MKPSAGDKAQFTTHKKASSGSVDLHTPLVVPSTGSTSFFMASEAELERREQARATVEASIADSNYGIHSIDESTSVNDAEDEREGPATLNPREKNRRRSTIGPKDVIPKEESLDSVRRQSSGSSNGSSPRRPIGTPGRIQLDTLSQPLTPISFASPLLGSEAPSSPKSLDGRSLRISDDDILGDTGSQAIASSGEEDEDLGKQATGVTQSGEGLQLIMPSIMMPKRRPFTERGRQMGKLKVLLAGPSGVGKTSLIKSIVQVCEDIVHVDSIPSATDKRRSSSKSKSRPTHSNPTKRVNEIHASTKSYPSWWSELEESDVVSRRRSTGENLLERNICFVDTPGYDNSTSALEGMKATTDYIETQMAKSTMPGELSDSELLNMLSGGGGLQVDIVFYLIDHDIKPTDIEYLRQLTPLAPTIPLLAKADTVSPSSLAELKPAILEQLRTSNITPFPMQVSSSVDLPFAICSSSSNDLESMDASLLMQSDFLPPLSPSDLPTLLNDLLTPSTLATLKHASARRLLHWRSNPRGTSFSTALATNLPPPDSPPSPPNLSLTTRQQTFSPLTHPRLAAHTQREERLANIRLANWAGNLQRSLAAERIRYEKLARDEREKWLREQIRRCADINITDTRAKRASDTALVAVRGSDSSASRRASPEKCGISLKGLMRNSSWRSDRDWRDDPLGLMRFGNGLTRTGWLAVRVIGGFGIVGGVALVVARMNGLEWDVLGFGAGLKEWWDGMWGCGCAD